MRTGFWFPWQTLKYSWIHRRLPCTSQDMEVTRSRANLDANPLSLPATTPPLTSPRITFVSWIRAEIPILRLWALALPQLPTVHQPLKFMACHHVDSLCYQFEICLLQPSRNRSHYPRGSPNFFSTSHPAAARDPLSDNTHVTTTNALEPHARTLFRPPPPTKVRRQAVGFLEETQRYQPTDEI